MGDDSRQYVIIKVVTISSSGCEQGACISLFNNHPTRHIRVFYQRNYYGTVENHVRLVAPIPQSPGYFGQILGCSFNYVYFIINTEYP